MKVKEIFFTICILLAAFAVSTVFLLYGLTIYFLKGLFFFRLGFYLPALCIIIYIYFVKQKHGLFLEALAFAISLMLAMTLTIDLMPL
jgi:hypothetical protein